VASRSGPENGQSGVVLESGFIAVFRFMVISFSRQMRSPALDALARSDRVAQENGALNYGSHFMDWRPCGRRSNSLPGCEKSTGLPGHTSRGCTRVLAVWDDDNPRSWPC
jgi:hypothetical protein